MKFLATVSKLAFVGTQTASRNSSSGIHPAGLVLGSRSSTMLPLRMLSLTHSAARQQMTQRPMAGSSSGSTRLFSSRSTGDVQLQNVGRAEMEEILEDYEVGGREESGYVVLDVREPNEVAFTGSLSPNTINLPLQLLAQQNVFALDEDEFEEVCGFPKPTPDETLVFSCAAGIRSVHAAQFAAMNGYTNLVNYMGGANEWFR